MGQGCCQVQIGNESYLSFSVAFMGVILLSHWDAIFVASTTSCEGTGSLTSWSEQ